MDSPRITKHGLVVERPWLGSKYAFSVLFGIDGLTNKPFHLRPSF